MSTPSKMCQLLSEGIVKTFSSQYQNTFNNDLDHSEVMLVVFLKSLTHSKEHLTLTTASRKLAAALGPCSATRAAFSKFTSITYHASQRYQIKMCHESTHRQNDIEDIQVALWHTGIVQALQSLLWNNRNYSLETPASWRHLNLHCLRLSCVAATLLLLIHHHHPTPPPRTYCPNLGNWVTSIHLCICKHSLNFL